MNCPHCASASKEQSKKTSLGYPTFHCSICHCTFNERTGTPFNFLKYPPDIVLLVVRWRLRYKLSLRDLAEMFLERGFVFTHEAVRDWKRVLPHSLRINYAENDADKQGPAGISMKHMSKCMGTGLTSIVPLITMET